MAEPRASRFAQVMAVTHVIVVGVGLYRLIREPSWWFGVLLGVIALYAFYWIRAAMARN